MEPAPLPKEHRRIGDELDEIYIEAVSAATYAQAYLVHRRGNPNEVFHQFYLPFVALYNHTRDTREMVQKPEYNPLIDEIDAWSNKSSRKHRVSDLIRQGLVLFSKYRVAVITSGAVVIKRE